MTSTPRRGFTGRSRLAVNAAIAGIAGIAALLIGGGVAAARAVMAPPTPLLAFGGDTTVVWGPDTMRTTNGNKTTFVEAFGITPAAGQQYALHLQRIGSGNLSQGDVRLNHRDIANKNAFPTPGAAIILPVKLTGADTVKVEVSGGAGSGLVLSLVSSTDATVALWSYTYTKTSGSTLDTTATFQKTAAHGAPAYLYVNAVPPAGFNKASADIWLNGTKIVGDGANDFSFQVTSFALPVTLVGGANTIRVQEHGQNPARFSLEIRATTTVPPALTIATPAPGTITKNATIDVTGTVTDATPVTVTVNGVTATLGGGNSYSATVPLASEGNNTITVHAVNAAGLTTDSTRVVIRDTQAPTLMLASPTDQLLTNEDSVTVSGTVTDANMGTLTVQGVPIAVGGGGAFTTKVALAEGANFIIVTATDAATNESSITRQVNRDQTPPTLNVTAPTEGATTAEATIAVTGTVSDANGPVTVTVNGSPVTVTSGAFSTNVALTTGANTITVVATDPATNTTTVVRHVTRTEEGGEPTNTMTEVLGVDAINAPALNPTEAAPVALSTAFLYNAANPVQTGVQAGAIDSVRAGVVRGRVRAPSGDALADVTVTILDHPELGQTLSRANGFYDLAVNAGGGVVLNYAKAGYAPVQRRIERMEWQEMRGLDDVYMTALAANADTITFTAPVEVARGPVQTDASGSRRQRAFFKQGTTATLVMPNGDTQAAPTLHVRLTEYTVGPNGPQAMPGDLPLSSAYTYAFKLSADQAIAAGAPVIEFSQPVAFYTDNFLGFPVGTPVPIARYDEASATWIAEANGRVIEILGVSGDSVTIDVDGDGTAESSGALDAFGIDAAERAALADEYAAGATLWRYTATKSSAHDPNWMPAGSAPNPATEPTGTERNTQEPDCRPGCVIEVTNQVLRDAIGVVGAPFTLAYSSARSSGATAGSILRVPVTGPSFNPVFVRAIAEVHVAGRVFTQTFAPASNLFTTFSWDGLDAYGRAVLGAKATVYRRYYMEGEYAVSTAESGFAVACRPPAGEVLCDGTGVPTRQIIEGARTITNVLMTRPANRISDVAGWDVNVHHFFDPVSRTLLLGTGENLKGDELIMPARSRFAGAGGTGNAGDGGNAIDAQFRLIRGMAAGLDGSVYVADRDAHVVRRITRAGIISRIAGTGAQGNGAPGDDALATALRRPTGLAFARDGRLYISDGGNSRVLRLESDGTLSLVAGGNDSGDTGDDGPASAAQLTTPDALALRPGGSLLILDVGANRIREVTPDGQIHAFAGKGSSPGPCAGEGEAAVAICGPLTGVAAFPDGRVAVSSDTAVRVIGADGRIRTVGGLNRIARCSSHAAQSGLQANEVGFCPEQIAIASDGSIITVELDATVVRAIGPDGFVTRLRTCEVEVLPTLRANPVVAVDAVASLTVGAAECRRVALGPEGEYYTSSDATIQRYDLPLPGFKNAAFRVPSQDGSEVYAFDSHGRHLSTADALTNAVLLTFQYDGAGRLASVTDADDNVTTIARNGSGVPTTITSPYGEVTTLTVDGSGRLRAVRNPAGERDSVTYTAGGSLASRIDARGGTTTFTYDSLGRLSRDDNELGGFAAFARQIGKLADTVTTTDGLGRVSTSILTDTATTGEARRSVDPAGIVSRSSSTQDGHRRTISPDGTVLNAFTVPDPRWGGNVQQLDSAVLRLPSGQETRAYFRRTVTLADPFDPASVETQTDEMTVNGQRFRGVYDAAANTFTTTSPESRVHVLTLDAKGRVTQSAVDGLAPIDYAYDSRGRLASVTQGDRTETYTYNAQGRLQTVTDPLSRVTSFAYDAAGRVTSEVLPGGRTIAFAYDAAGNLTSLTPAGKPAHTFGYNAANLPTTYQAPEVSGSTGTTSYSYSIQKELLSLTRPDTQQVSITYTSGRPTAIASPLGTHGIGYSPTTGQVTSLSAPGGVGMSFLYNGALPTRTTWTGPVAGHVRFEYDNTLRLREILVNGDQSLGTIGYTSDGQPTFAGAVGFGYRSDNGLLEYLSASTYESAWSYDSLAQVQTYVVVASETGDTTFRANYTYDQLGRITQVEELLLTDTATYAYGYDAAGRLATVQKSGITVAAYTYDLNGNRTQTTYPQASQNIAATYDNQDRLLSYGSNTYSYTGNGELTLKVTGTDSTQYSYDVFGNLRKVNLPSGDSVEYVIDGQQRRIGRKFNGTLEKGWLYQSQLAIAAEVDAAGTVTKLFSYGNHANVPAYMYAADTGYRILTDHLGSVRLVIDDFGNVRQRLDYDAYGRVLVNTNPGFQPFGYAGGLLDDATGLTRFGARDYDAETGRWTAPDPIKSRGGSGNYFAYAAGDPIGFVDRTGFWPTWTHNELIKYALGGAATPAQIAAIQRASEIFDTGRSSFGDVQTPDRAFMHAMRGPGETALQAVMARDQFVRRMLMIGRSAFLAGDLDRALACIGFAIHPYMDMTSPAHTELGGSPRIWSHPVLQIAPHVAAEVMASISPAVSVYRTNQILIQGAFFYVTGK